MARFRSLSWCSGNFQPHQMTPGESGRENWGPSGDLHCNSPLHQWWCATLSCRDARRCWLLCCVVISGLVVLPLLVGSRWLSETTNNGLLLSDFGWRISNRKDKLFLTFGKHFKITFRKGRRYCNWCATCYTSLSNIDYTILEVNLCRPPDLAKAPIHDQRGNPISSHCNVRPMRKSLISHFRWIDPNYFKRFHLEGLLLRKMCSLLW